MGRGAGGVGRGAWGVGRGGGGRWAGGGGAGGDGRWAGGGGRGGGGRWAGGGGRGVGGEWVQPLAPQGFWCVFDVGGVGRTHTGGGGAADGGVQRYGPVMWGRGWGSGQRDPLPRTRPRGRGTAGHTRSADPPVSEAVVTEVRNTPGPGGNALALGGGGGGGADAPGHWGRGGGGGGGTPGASRRVATGTRTVASRPPRATAPTCGTPTPVRHPVCLCAAGALWQHGSCHAPPPGARHWRRGDRVPDPHPPSSCFRHPEEMGGTPRVFPTCPGPSLSAPPCAQGMTVSLGRRLGGKKIALRGGGGTRKPIFPTPPLSLLDRRDRRGGFRAGAPDLPCRGGAGVNPTSMAQNDTHVALIILTTQMWGGKLLVEKTFSGQIFVFLCLWRQHPFLHKTKGPTRNPISPTPPPSSFGGHPCHPPPPPPAEQFSGCPAPRLCAEGAPHVHRGRASQGQTCCSCPACQSRARQCLPSSGRNTSGHYRVAHGTGPISNAMTGPLPDTRGTSRGVSAGAHTCASPRAIQQYFAWLSMRRGPWVMPSFSATFAASVCELWAASTDSQKRTSAPSAKTSGNFRRIGAQRGSCWYAGLSGGGMG